MSVPATSSPDPSGVPVSAPVDTDAFRRAVGHFATGVTVVTTRVDDVDHAMTASAFTSLSLDPVLVLVCVDKEARFRDAVLESGTWGVSVLSTAGRPAAEWFATKGRPLVGQLDRYPHHRGRATDVALLDGAVAWLEVRSTAIYDGGDHDIVVGEVIDLAIGDRDAPALVYHRRNYGSLPKWGSSRVHSPGGMVTWAARLAGAGCATHHSAEVFPHRPRKARADRPSSAPAAGGTRTGGG